MSTMPGSLTLVSGRVFRLFFFGRIITLCCATCTTTSDLQTQDCWSMLKFSVILSHSNMVHFLNLQDAWALKLFHLSWPCHSLGRNLLLIVLKSVLRGIRIMSLTLTLSGELVQASVTSSERYQPLEQCHARNLGQSFHVNLPQYFNDILCILLIFIFYCSSTIVSIFTPP